MSVQLLFNGSLDLDTPILVSFAKQFGGVLRELGIGNPLRMGIPDAAHPPHFLSIDGLLRLYDVFRRYMPDLREMAVAVRIRTEDEIGALSLLKVLQAGELSHLDVYTTYDDSTTPLLNLSRVFSRMVADSGDVTIVPITIDRKDGRCCTPEALAEMTIAYSNMHRCLTQRPSAERRILESIDMRDLDVYTPAQLSEIVFDTNGQPIRRYAQNVFSMLPFTGQIDAIIQDLQRAMQELEAAQAELSGEGPYIGAMTVSGAQKREAFHRGQERYQGLVDELSIAKRRDDFQKLHYSLGQGTGR